MKKKSLKTYETPKFMMKLAAIGGAAFLMSACGGDNITSDPEILGDLTIATNPTEDNEPMMSGNVVVDPEYGGSEVIDGSYNNPTDDYMEPEWVGGEEISSSYEEIEVELSGDIAIEPDPTIGTDCVQEPDYEGGLIIETEDN